MNSRTPDYLTVNYQYDNAGRPLSRVMSSGARTLFAYDNGGWLHTLNQFDAAGTQVVSQSYTRDHVGNITVAEWPLTGSQF
jgi:YD repeat-containing protein